MTASNAQPKTLPWQTWIWFAVLAPAGFLVPACGVREDCSRLDAWQISLDQLEENDQVSLSMLTSLQGQLPAHCDSASILLANAYHDAGNTYNRAHHDVASALACFHQALYLRRQVYGQDSDHKDIQRAYFNLGLLYSQMNATDSSLYYFGCIKKGSAANLPYYLKLIETARIYSEQGEYRTAENYLMEAYDILHDPGSATVVKGFKWEVFKVGTDLFRQRKLFSRALEMAHEGLFHGRSNDSSNRADSIALAGLHLDIGSVWQDSLYFGKGLDPQARRRLVDSAIVHTHLSLELYRSAAAENNVIGGVLRNLGELYRRSGQYRQALNMLNQGIYSVGNDNEEHLLRSGLYINRGETRYALGEWVQALADFDTARYWLTPNRAWHPDTPEDEELDALKPSYLFLLQTDRALAHLAMFHANRKNVQALESAFADYSTLAPIADRMRSDFLSFDAKFNLSADLQENLSKAFDVTLTLARLDTANRKKYLDHALSISENSKATTLLEAVRLKSAINRLPAQVQARENALKAQEADIKNELYLQRESPAVMENLKKALLDNFEAQRSFRDSLRHHYPKYFSHRSYQSNLNSDTIRAQILEPGQYLLEYYVQNSLLHTFFVGPDTFFLLSTPLPIDVEKQIEQFTVLAGQRAQEKLFCKTAHALYRLLLSDAAAFLPKDARVVVVADAPFHTLPFEALLREYDKGTVAEQVAAERFVLYQYNISYAYSANLLLEMRRKTIPAHLQRALAGFAPDFSAAETSPCDPTLPSSLCTSLSALTPLPNAGELEKINKKVSLRCFAGDDVTPKQFLAFSKTYSAVHIASHCVLNDEDPDFNFIAFSGVKRGQQQDGMLFLNDLYAEPLHLDFVGFSACETSKGQFRRAEGNLSMARGLATAGVKSFVTTLWPVYNQNNAAIFPNFYAEINNGVPKDVALTRAKRHFARNPDRSPFDWAGLVLIGDASPMVLNEAGTNSDNLVYVYGALLALVLLAGGALLAYFRRPYART
ncbi:MAG: CHAT domain-containing tetratricopeptide repeat protein [Saprospiraceae bacterium]|nr:CHAT domain-containing tetratricopeptide repeat protein [Saprospiraceae bacterium]